MTQKKLAKLADLAAMIRDRELAELARHSAERRRLQDDLEQTRRSARDALTEGQDNLLSARIAAGYGRWALARQDQLTGQLAEVQAAIDSQKQRTALAVGRHRNLEDIAAQVKTAATRKAKP